MILKMNHVNRNVSIIRSSSFRVSLRISSNNNTSNIANIIRIKILRISLRWILMTVLKEREEEVEEEPEEETTMLKEMRGVVLEIQDLMEDGAVEKEAVGAEDRMVAMLVEPTVTLPENVQMSMEGWETACVVAGVMGMVNVMWVVAVVAVAIGEDLNVVVAIGKGLNVVVEVAIGEGWNVVLVVVVVVANFKEVQI